MTITTIRPRLAAAAALAALLCGCHPATHEAPARAAAPPAAAVDAARIANVAAEPDQWLTTGRDGGGS